MLITAFVPAAASAAVFEWSGELSFALEGFTQIEATGTGLATLNDGLALESLALDGGLHASIVVAITDPIVTAGGLVSVRAEASLGMGTFRIDLFGASSLPEVTSGRVPVHGALRLCLFYAGCNSGSLTVPLTTGGVHGVGLGGGTIAMGYDSPRISLIGAPWTIRTASLQVPTAAPTFNETMLPASTTIFSFGWLHGPLSFTYSAASTWNGEGGTVQLVTPARVLGLSEVPAGGFARLRLHFVPEPAPLLLWAALAFGFGALGRARCQRSRSHPRRGT